ncbi:MAG TPA: hypothetical protein VGT05_00455 [Patescibacteria group bacterium]|nr:hypothetical protein [Patescibacteria group bacterium]
MPTPSRSSFLDASRKLRADFEDARNNVPHRGSAGGEGEAVKKFYDDKKASQTFIDHCITLCKFYLLLKEKYKTFTYTSKTELWNNKDFDDLKPDAYIERTVEKKGNKKTETITTHYLLDLFDAHVPRYALRSRINQYIKLNDTYIYLKKEFPFVLLILPDEKKLKHLKRYIRIQFKEKYDLEDVSFSLTTHKEIMKQGFGQEIWETLRENDKN